MTSFDITPTFLDLVAGLDKYIYGLLIIVLSINILHLKTYYDIFSKKGKYSIYKVNDNEKYIHLYKKKYRWILILVFLSSFISIYLSLKYNNTSYTEMPFIVIALMAELWKTNLIKNLYSNSKILDNSLKLFYEIRKSYIFLIKNRPYKILVQLIFAIIIIPIGLAYITSVFFYPKAYSDYEFVRYRNLYGIEDLKEQEKIHKLGSNNTFIQIKKEKEDEWYFKYLVRDKEAYIELRKIPLNKNDNIHIHGRLIDNLKMNGYIPCLYKYSTTYKIKELNSYQKMFLPDIDYKDLEEKYIIDSNKQIDYYFYLDSTFESFFKDFNLEYKKSFKPADYYDMQNVVDIEE